MVTVSLFPKNQTPNPQNDLWEKITDGLAAIDPVAWCEKHLMLDGKPFKINGNGYKPFSDIYRTIARSVEDKEAKPIIVLKSRQVGMTTTASALSLYFMCSGIYGNNKAPIRIMHTFPTLSLAIDYSKVKLSTLLNNSIPFTKDLKNKSYCASLIDSSSASSDQLQFKQFRYSNHIWIESCSERLVGKTCDLFICDELQSSNIDHLNNGLKILLKSQYGRQGEGVQLFFGTPRNKNSDFNKMWNQSNKQFYFLGCLNCKEHFPFYTGDDSWEKVWLHDYTVKCTICGHEQDKRQSAEIGKWKLIDESLADNKYIGFCINQLYMPEFTKEQIIAQKPENHPTHTERAYRNEVLGEFYSGTDAGITTHEIREMCGEKRYMTRSINPSSTKKVYAGFDWGEKSIDESDGGKKGKSYSCAVICTVENNGELISVEYATPLLKNSPEYKIQFVEELFRKFKINLAVSDQGYANDLGYVLATKLGDSFINSRAIAGGQLKNFYKFDSDVFPKEIKFDKDNLINEMHTLMKKGRIKLPYGSYEQIAFLAEHISNLEIKYTLDRFGKMVGRYVKSGPTDGAAALMNCLLAIKFDQTNGFKITDPRIQVKDVNKINHIPVAMAYAPNLK